MAEAWYWMNTVVVRQSLWGVEECIHSDKNKTCLLNISIGMETCNCELSFFFMNDL